MLYSAYQEHRLWSLGFSQLNPVKFQFIQDVNVWRAKFYELLKETCLGFSIQQRILIVEVHGFTSIILTVIYMSLHEFVRCLQIYSKYISTTGEKCHKFTHNLSDKYTQKVPPSFYRHEDLLNTKNHSSEFFMDIYLGTWIALLTD